MFEIIFITILCLCVISITWFTIKTGISPMPSSAKACRTILLLSQQADEGDMIDLGSGWGTLLFALAKKYPERQLIGYELSFLPYAYSRIYKTIFRLHHVTIYRQDFLHADFLNTARPSTALMVCYLFPAGMRKLQQKLTRQQQHHCLLISSTFALPDTKPSQSIQLDDIYHTPIYLYALKKAEQHTQSIHEIKP